MAVESIPSIPAIEGIGKFIGIAGTLFGGIVGIYFLTFIMKWVYSVRTLKALKDIKEELEVLNRKKKNESKTKKRDNKKIP